MLNGRGFLRYARAASDQRRKWRLGPQSRQTTQPLAVVITAVVTKMAISAASMVPKTPLLLLFVSIAFLLSARPNLLTGFSAREKIRNRAAYAA